MKQLTRALIALFLLMFANNAQAYQVTEYRGIEVTYEMTACRETAYACYHYAGDREGTINFREWNSQGHYEYLISHEYGHHIWHHKMNQAERDLYENIDSLGLDLDTSRMEASDYAYKNIKESFAESVFHYEYRRPENIKTIADLKIYVAGYFLDKYYKD